MSGLSGTVVLQNNAGDDLSVAASGPFVFGTLLATGAAYNVTVKTSPAGQICTTANAAGTVASANITNITITCASTYSVGGTVSGLSGTVVLQNNAGDDLSVAASGPFVFGTLLASGAAYNVTVKTSPAARSARLPMPLAPLPPPTSPTSRSPARARIRLAALCLGFRGRWCCRTTVVAIWKLLITNITITCASTYSVGGTVSGLSGTVVLQNNAGDDLSVAASGPFVFGTLLATGAAYNVTVKTSPAGQICTVAGGSGTVSSANVTSITVTCTGSSAPSGSDDFNRADGGLGVSWAAMSDGGLLISSQVVVGSSGGHAGHIRIGEAYGSDQSSQVEVTSTQLTGGQWIGPVVRAQNGGQDTYLGIYFWNSGSPVLRLYKRSAGTWIQLGGSFNSGPLAAGTRLKLSAVGSRISFLQDGVERIVVSDSSLSGGAPGIMAYGAAKADNWSGGNATSPSTYSVGGTVSGLSGTMVLQNNAGDDLSVAASGPFVFGTLLASGAAYNVTVKTSPAGQICTTANAAGTVASANITNITITCASGTAGTQIVFRSTDANGVASYDVTSADNGYGTQMLRVLAPTNPAPGVAHNFLYVLPVEAGLASVYGDGLEALRALNAQNQYNLTIIEPSFAIEPWYADNPSDPNLRYETFMANDLAPWVKQNLASTGNEQNWLIGFSKSGIGAADLILKHPDLFTLAASWDFPADMTTYNDFGTSSASSYGTDANFQANYRLTPAFLDAHKAPFQTNNRIWIGGYSSSAPFQDDISDYDALLTSVGIAHTTGTPQAMLHRWDSGWVPIALAALSQDAGALGS